MGKIREVNVKQEGRLIRDAIERKNVEWEILRHES